MIIHIMTFKNQNSRFPFKSVVKIFSGSGNTNNIMVTLCLNVLHNVKKKNNKFVIWPEHLLVNTAACQSISETYSKL